MSKIEVRQQEVVLLKIDNVDAVHNGPTAPSTFTMHRAHDITSLMTYHWNNARGVPGGTVALRASDGTVYGPWPVVTTPGQGGVPNAYWTATPNAHVPAGAYTVVDSSPSTWATNGQAGNRGMTTIKGIEHGQHCCCCHCHHC
jgi:hypothetical protein